MSNRHREIDRAEEIVEVAREGRVMSGAAGKQESFSVASEQRGHAAHLHVFGEIDMATAPILEGWLQKAESNGNTTIVVDAGQVTFLDASGLRTFLGAAERAIQSGRTFAITGAPALVQRVFLITGTTHLLAADPLTLPPDRHPEEASFVAQAGAGGDVPAVHDNQRAAHARR